jgi:hypothetical protein
MSELHLQDRGFFSDDQETMRLERWEANIEIDSLTPGGLKIFVIQGGFSESGEVF